MTLKLDAVSKSYVEKQGRKRTILSDINLLTAAGEFIVIQGESGCGKSTLLNLIAGHERPSSGTIHFGGKAVLGPSPERILLFQQPTLIPWLSLRENIEFGCKIRAEQWRYQEETDRYLESFGLKNRDHLYPAEISIGMAHRACLIRGLLAVPKLLLLDEPFRSLDTVNRYKLMKALISQWQEKKFGVILVTHNIEEALMLGTKIIRMSETPTTLSNTTEITMPYPRSPIDADFIRLKRSIYADYGIAMGEI